MSHTSQLHSSFGSISMTTFNTMFTRFLGAALLAFAVGGTAHAQSDPDEALIARIKQRELNIQFGAGFLVGNPQGAFRDSLIALGAPSVGYGFSFYGGYHFEPVPLSIILDGGVLFMGGNTRERVVPSGLFRDTIETTTQTSVIPVSVAVRLQPNVLTWFYPYVEAIGGFNLHMSRFSLSQHRIEEIRSQDDSRSDAGWTYGVGAGFAIKTADIITLPSDLQRITLEMRMRYVASGRIDVSTVRETDDVYEFKTASVASANFVTFLVGFTFQF